MGVVPRTHLRIYHTLIIQVLAQPLHYLDLFLDRQAGDGRLDHISHRGLVHRDKALVIHKGEEAHDELTIHPIRNAAMSGDAIAEILDLEGPLKT